METSQFVTLSRENKNLKFPTHLAYKEYTFISNIVQRTQPHENWWWHLWLGQKKSRNTSSIISNLHSKLDKAIYLQIYQFLNKTPIQVNPIYQ